MIKPVRFLTPVCLSMLLAAGACSDNGSTEKTGQKIDKVTESAKETLAKTDATVGDAALAERIKAELREDSALKTADISVDARDGAVVLTGTVQNPEEIIRAVKRVRSVDGVKSVENRLTVRPKE